jgi:exopolyphosphatase/pppGpp-phosphohydrolase
MIDYTLERGATMAITGREGRTALKAQTIRRWVHRHLGGVEHERRVASIVSGLLTVTSPLHSLSPRNRRLLKMACYVHDVGRAYEKKSHPKVGAMMVRQARQLPLTNRERRALAYLTMFHRGEVPPVGDAPILKRTDDHFGLWLALAFLRAADALDSRSLTSPNLSLTLRGRRLRIQIRLTEPSRKAERVFSRRKKLRLLEQALGIQIEVDIRIPELAVAA